MKYPEDFLKEQNSARASEGISWYCDFLRGEDVDEPPREKLFIWLEYAQEVLGALAENHKAKRLLDYD